MRVYYSGGSPIAETGLRDPSADVMLSFYVDTRKKRTKPNARMNAIFTIRDEAKREKRKDKKAKATGKHGTGKSNSGSGRVLTKTPRGSTRPVKK